MRVSTCVTALAFAAMVASAGCGAGYRSYGVTASYGAPLDIYSYEPGYWGDWRTNYSLWSPVVVYDYNGGYYPTQIRGSRPVEVYHYQNQYFMPPQDNGWAKTETRFNAKQRPTARDYQRARPRPSGNGRGGGGQ